MELVVEEHGTNKEHRLDLLTAGSTVGAYSMINESAFNCTAKAKTSLSLLILKRDDFFTNAENSDHLQEAIEEAT